MDILVKLTEEEQDVLLNHAAHYPPPGPWSSIAEKIERTREDKWEVEPATPEQGNLRLKAMRKLPEMTEQERNSAYAAPRKLAGYSEEFPS
jgi:hypothetical protein